MKITICAGIYYKSFSSGDGQAPSELNVNLSTEMLFKLCRKLILEKSPGVLLMLKVDFTVNHERNLRSLNPRCSLPDGASLTDASFSTSCTCLCR